MIRVFVGVGSNEGDRSGVISSAVRALGRTDGIRLVQLAMIAETDPVGGPPQAPYLNTVVELRTTREPGDLLRVLQQIERDLGRLPSRERWAPRPIDLDLLLYGDRVMAEPDLILPHPRMHERRFVLEPLVQLAPEIRHPVLKETAATLLARCESGARSPAVPFGLVDETKRAGLQGPGGLLNAGAAGGLTGVRLTPRRCA